MMTPSRLPSRALSLLLAAITLESTAVAADQATTQPVSTSDAIRIALVGDSTVTDNAGWGQAFAACYVPPKAIVTNFSKGGRSSKSFITEQRWQDALALKPHYMLIQFGHNDEPGHGPDRESEPATAYRANLVHYIDEARAIGATPVLLTPISRRQWGSDGHIKSSLAPYAEAVRAVAKDKGVPLIDLHDRSIEVYESLGKPGCALISPLKSDGVTPDGTHLNEVGGTYFGALVADELRRIVPDLGHAFRLPNEPSTRPAAATQPTVAPAFTLPPGSRTITVAADGSGDVTSIQDAIALVPDNASERMTIRVKPGVYYGFLLVPKSKRNVTLIGEDPLTTIITYGLNVRAPLPSGVTRFHNGTGFVVQGEGFLAENITFRNTSGDHGQAMALRTDGDRGIYRNCRLLGWQDTLLASSGRQFFDRCYIEGRVDFIYGGATAWFEQCEIKSKLGGYLTAASTPADHPFGYVFNRCRITSDDGVPTYLGRPWRPDASVTFLNCEMGGHIRPEGWHNWGKASNEQTARYAEFGTTGPGAPQPGGRVPWAKTPTKAQADVITIDAVLGGSDGWKPASN